jgi:hypothetical protein
MVSTLLDSTPKDKENPGVVINGFVCAAPWAKDYLLRIILITAPDLGL